MDDTEPQSPFKSTESNASMDGHDHKSNDILSKRVCENSNSDENDNDNDNDEHDKIPQDKSIEVEVTQSLKTQGEEVKVAVSKESIFAATTSEQANNTAALEQATQE